MNLVFTYGGLVENNQDPEKLGRLKVRVPHVYGTTGGAGGYIGTNDLPWALPAGMPAGSTKASGGFSHLPSVGDKVWVRFLDGEPEKPIWEWGMQTIADRKTFGLHTYKPGTAPNEVGSPDRAAWFKWSNGIEINEGSLIATTSQGYNVILSDASQQGSNDGNIKISTALGQYLKLDDSDRTGQMFILDDINFQVGNDWSAYASDFTFNALTGDYTVNVDIGSFEVFATNDINLNTASNFNIDALQSIQLSAVADIQLTATANMTLDCVTLSLGTGSTEPFVLGNQMTAWMSSLLTYLASHTHSNGDEGAPTGPPIVPPLGIVQPLPATVVSRFIYGH